MSDEQLRRYRESKQRQADLSLAKQAPKAMHKAPVNPVQDILNEIQAASAPRPAPPPKRHPARTSSESSSSSSNSTPARVANNARAVPAAVKKTIPKITPKQRKPPAIPVRFLLDTVHFAGLFLNKNICCRICWSPKPIF